MTASYNGTFKPSTCPVIATKSFNIPVNTCAEEAHTGKNAYILKPGGIGTSFNVYKSQLPAASEFNRKYSALVWMHTSCPMSTSLVVNYYASSALSRTFTASCSAPYLTSGNWKLVRVDADAPTVSEDRIEVYVQNSSTTSQALYDDIRVAPFTANMTAKVYDPLFDRLSATLDQNHLATFYKYDSRGRLLEVKTELTGTGPVTLKKYAYNDQNKN